MDVSVAGPLARNARDLSLALDLLGGPNRDDAKAWSWRMPAARHTRLQDFRIGHVFDDDVWSVGSDVASVYDDALSALQKTGAKIERGWPEGIDPRAQMNTFAYLVSALMTADLNADARQRLRQRFEADPHDMFAAAAVEPYARWLHETVQRLSIRARWQK
jgi:amidase